MAEKLVTEQDITVEEVTVSNVFATALLDAYWERKGLVTKNELIDEIKQLNESVAGGN